MDNYDLFKIRRGKWIERAVTENHIVWQCSECGSVDDPEKETCSCCRATMEAING